MPFEISPRFVPQEIALPVRPFQWAADAMLRGCALTGPLRGAFYRHSIGARDRACALGALQIGLGIDSEQVTNAPPETLGVENAYALRYGSRIEQDNDSGRFTREQIAARIAAL